MLDGQQQRQQQQSGKNSKILEKNHITIYLVPFYRTLMSKKTVEQISHENTTSTSTSQKSEENGIDRSTSTRGKHTPTHGTNSTKGSFHTRSFSLGSRWFPGLSSKKIFVVSNTYTWKENLFFEKLDR